MTLKEYMIECLDNLDNPARLAELRYSGLDKDCGYRSGLRFLAMDRTPETDMVARYVIYHRYMPEVIDKQLRLF